MDSNKFIPITSSEMMDYLYFKKITLYWDYVNSGWSHIDKQPLTYTIAGVIHKTTPSNWKEAFWCIKEEDLKYLPELIRLFHFSI